MGKTYSNYRIVVYLHHDFSDDVIEMEGLEGEVKRHCDRAGNIVREHDIDCDRCGLRWEEDEEGRPQCCEEAVFEWEEARAEELKRADNPSS
jgi:hypothetical protein